MPGTWRRHPDVAHVGDAGRAALVALHHLDRAAVILEGSSGVIWALLEVPLEEATLLNKLAEHYQVSHDQVRGPAVSFLREMRQLDLLIHEESVRG